MLPRALHTLTRRTSLAPILLAATARAMSAKADLRYVSKPASDAANQAVTPAKYPRELYPEIEAHDSGMLSVGDGHSLYYDVSGNPDGVPCIFLHGGPGGGISPRSRRFFDPAFFRIVIFDQRGSGKSQPNAAEDLQGSLVENNTPKLVEDIEKLREHLKVDKWGMVLGGSWGSTLALAYAEAHPSKVRTLLLRGVFLFEPEEVDYLFAKGGTQGQHPAAWAAYCNYIRDTSDDFEAERQNLLGAYWKRLTSDDAATRLAAASAFVGYELSISKTFVEDKIIRECLETPSQLVPFAVMEVSYMLNAGFMSRGQLIADVGKLSSLERVCISHGRSDFVCQPVSAYRLSEALGKLKVPCDLDFVAAAGHSDTEPGLVSSMVTHSDAIRDLLAK
mmetsp:Transcript_19903/g.51731  ORF Transcript_19903/g.51731 Transcript_19903/m.51731 type:complete len:391 (-) Transcript_19903:30-1202(-)